MLTRLQAWWYGTTITPASHVAPASAKPLIQANQAEQAMPKIPEQPTQQPDEDEVNRPTDLPSIPDGDPIEVEETELQAKIRQYEAEIKIWNDILQKELETPVTAHALIQHQDRLGLTQKLINIFHSIIRVLQDLKEAVELPESFIEDKLEEARAHFVNFKFTLDTAMGNYTNVQNGEARKEILVAICKDSIGMLNELRKLDLEVFSEIKYALAVREGVEKIPEVIPTPLSIFKDIIDKKVIEELTRNELYLEIQDMVAALGQLMVESQAQLDIAKQFVKTNMPQQMREVVKLHANSSALFTPSANQSATPAATTDNVASMKLGS